MLTNDVVSFEQPTPGIHEVDLFYFLVAKTICLQRNRVLKPGSLLIMKIMNFVHLLFNRVISC